jgi:hypothetical protein
MQSTPCQTTTLLAANISHNAMTVIVMITSAMISDAPQETYAPANESCYDDVTGV